MYDLLAGKENMETSYLMTRGKTIETFPMLKSDGLVGSLVYYDGRLLSLFEYVCMMFMSCQVNITTPA